MSKTIEQVRQELNAKLSSEDVSEREGGNGRTLSYVSSYYVIDRLNQILGQGNWSYDTEEMRLVHSGAEEAYGKTKFVAHYIAKVHLIATIGDKVAQFSDYGYGDGTDKGSAGKAHELAAKEAATDGLKRCAKNLGMKLGLALYEKEQSNVEDEPAPKASVPAPSAPAPISQGPASVSDRGSAKAPAKGEERKKVNLAIASVSKILLTQEKRTMTQLKQDLKDTYSVNSKEELSDEQAKEFLAKLEGVAVNV